MKYWTNESKSSYHLHLKENPTTFISEKMHKLAFVKWFTKYCENIHELSIPQTMWNISQSLSLMTYNVPHGTLTTYNLHYRLSNRGMVYIEGIELVKKFTSSTSISIPNFLMIGLLLPNITPYPKSKSINPTHLPPNFITLS